MSVTITKSYNSSWGNRFKYYLYFTFDKPSNYVFKVYNSYDSSTKTYSDLIYEKTLDSNGFFSPENYGTYVVIEAPESAITPTINSTVNSNFYYANKSELDLNAYISTYHQSTIETYSPDVIYAYNSNRTYTFTVNESSSISITNNTTGFTFTSLPTSWNTGETLTISCSANSGYEVTTAPYLLIDGTTQAEFTLADNVYTYSAIPNAETSLSIEGVASEVIQPLTINYDNISGFTFTEKPTTYTIGENLKISCSALSGYNVEDVPHILVRKNNVTRLNKYFDLTDNVYSIDKDLTDSLSSDVLKDSTIYVYGTATSPTGKTISITNNTTGFTFTSLPTSWNTGETLTISCSANSGYEVTTAPYLLIDGTTQAEFTLADNVYTYSAIPNAETSLSIEGVAISESADYIVVDYTNISNFDFAVNPSQYEIGTVLNISCSVSSGYSVATAPYLLVRQDNYTRLKLDFDLSNNVYSISKNLTNSLSSDVLKNCTIYIYGSATPSTPITTNYGIVNAYKVTTSILTDLANKRYYQSSTSSSTWENIDLMDYVYSIRKYYFNVTIGDSTNIVLGTITTTVSAPIITNEYFTLSCGTKQIPTPFNNCIDNQNEITIYIPFVGIETLDNYLIGKNISLLYYTNIVSGKTTVYLMVENTIYKTYNTVLYSEFPRKLNSQIVTIDNFVPYDLTPKIICYYPNETIVNINRTNIRSTIGDNTGLIFASNVTYKNIVATQDELNELDSILRNGIII